MKNLVFGALLVGAAGTGCIITTDNGNNAHLTATWSVKSLTTGASSACPADLQFDTAALYSQEVDSAGNNIGAPIIDLFNCEQGTGTSAALPPSTYYAWIELTNHDNSVLYAQSVSASVDLVDVDKSFSAQLLSDGGYFQLSWNLQDASTGAPLLCADAPDIGGLETIATEVGNAQNFASDIFQCEDHTGITAGFLSGNYTVNVHGIDHANPPGQVGPGVNLTNKTIAAPNKVTNLGTVTVPI